jgi:protein PhnA
VTVVPFWLLPGRPGGDAAVLPPGLGQGHGPPNLGDVNDSLPPCPECSSEYTYEMGALLVCPECAHEWSPGADEGADEAAEAAIKDAVGNILADGDTVTVVKDLKIKGSSTVIKVGTKVRGIRLVNGVGDHDIDCKVDGVGPMQLKSSVVKKI